LEKLQEMVETTIDLEAVSEHEFIIKADFDEDLLGMQSCLFIYALIAAKLNQLLLGFTRTTTADQRRTSAHG
jgi:hypothetical protein